MSEIMVCGQLLTIREYEGRRVVTFKDIDRVHGKTDGAARHRFERNRARFIEGEDYFKIQKVAKRPFGETVGIEVPSRGIIVLTESGYLMLVKTFTDDLAWQVQRELVNGYFKSRDIQEPEQENLTEIKSDIKAIKEQLAELTAGTPERKPLTFQAGSDMLKKRKSFINCMIADLAEGHNCTANKAISECYRYMKEQCGINPQDIHTKVCTERGDWSISVFEAVCSDNNASRAMMLAAADYLDGLENA